MISNTYNNNISEHVWCLSVSHWNIERVADSSIFSKKQWQQILLHFRLPFPYKPVEERERERALV